MKYFGFLAKFVVLPLAIFTFLNWRDSKRGKKLPEELRAMPAEATIAGLVGVAVAYTTPWDNYLVASRVWWYDPKLVVGRIGYVPIEEYSFFVLQTLLTGVWTMYVAKRTPHDDKLPENGWRFRIGMTLAVGGIWLWSIYNLFRGPKKRTYMSLMLSWALFPIMIQTLFGGDILWRHRRLVALGVLPTTLYLGVSDSLAIDSGTWTINPEKSVDYLIGGKLPLEEGLFFFLTNLLVSVGVTLVMAKDSQRRVPKFLRKYLRIKDVE